MNVTCGFFMSLARVLQGQSGRPVGCWSRLGASRQSGAVGQALANPGPVFRQVANDGVLFEEVLLILRRRLAAEQLPQMPEAIRLVGMGRLAGLFNLQSRKTPGQAGQPDQDPHPGNAPFGQHGLGPLAAGQTYPPNLG